MRHVRFNEDATATQVLQYLDEHELELHILPRKERCTRCGQRIGQGDVRVQLESIATSEYAVGIGTTIISALNAAFGELYRLREKRNSERQMRQ